MTQSESWRPLFRQAVSLIEQAQVIDSWTFGGGTAMMLQIGHRDSYDVDIFLEDPQLLGYLDPARQDFTFLHPPDAYSGDGTRFQKIAFEDIGEIDFIVAQPLSPVPFVMMEIEGVPTRVETVPEIITKKVVYRGAAIKARDVFDIAAACQTQRDAVITALAQYPEEVRTTISALDRLSGDFLVAAIAELSLREEFGEVAKEARSIARGVLVEAR